MDNTSLSGCWIIDAAHSSWSDGRFPPDMSLRLYLEFTQDRLRYHSENDTDRTQAVRTLDYDTVLDGSTSGLAGSPRFDTVRARQISALEFEILELLDGDVIVAAYWRFSEDGRTLWRWGVGKSPLGRSRTYAELFVRKD
ncbi:hypothetical protein AAC691_12145 [Nguyenibacter vanlangensis]|uniref:SnoaL-like domain-containing protein n=1 Tax=Nguyenibacter vanlangensis TaxID=1216886 RepID=A0ABZ3D0F5_9PROT